MAALAMLTIIRMIAATVKAKAVRYIIFVEVAGLVVFSVIIYVSVGKELERYYEKKVRIATAFGIGVYLPLSQPQVGSHFHSEYPQKQTGCQLHTMISNVLTKSQVSIL